MAHTKSGNFSIGDAQSDIREYITEYSKANGYAATHFADAVCKCGGTTFRIVLDDNEGAAVRLCGLCKESHPMCGSADYLEDAVPVEGVDLIRWAEVDPGQADSCKRCLLR
jgi:hypothetical protein